MAKAEKTLEKALDELNNLISEMEKPDISLEESFKKYNEGIELIKFCNSSIEKIEKKLVVLEEGMQ